jgi:molybdopterin molybdotransferase
MDGYAVRRIDWDRDNTMAFDIIGESLAGHPFTGPLGPHQSVRVFTGAVVPPHADLVVLQERVRKATQTTVVFEPHNPDESFVRPVGHDITQGDIVAEAAEQISPFTVGTLAAAGINRVEVFEKPTIGVFSSGDELIDPGSPLAAGQIYDSNRVAVLQLLQSLPCRLVDLGRLPDEPNAVTEKLHTAAGEADLLITSGGVSVGDADFITSTIEQLGELAFWKLNLKPGKPLAFGKINGCYIFGLPGNPVSTIVTLLLLAKPTILHLCGATFAPPMRVQAKVQETVAHTKGRTEFQRGVLREVNGESWVHPTGDQSSNRLSTFHGANCLVEVPGTSGDLQRAQLVTVIPFSGLL